MDQSLLDQYNAVRQSAGFLDLGPRRKIQVTGADHVQFLHAMITNDVQELPSLQGRYGALLRPTGKLVADFYYYRFPDHVLIDIAPSLSSALLETLQKFIIMDEVYLEDVSDAWEHISVQGPRSGELLRAILNTTGSEAHLAITQVVWRGQTCWLITKAHLADQGFEVLASPGVADSLREELLRGRPDIHVTQVGDKAEEILRLERGIPLFGVDMTENNNPVEAGLDDAISLDKGCYVGQEVISKATYVGGVGRHLCQLLIETDTPIEKGAEVSTDDGQVIGLITSAAFSPSFDQTVALGYLKRDNAREEARHWVAVAGDRTAARVLRRAGRLMRES